MAKLEYARLIIKSGTGTPTVPPSSDHDNGDWVMSDIYEFELYIDDATGKLYTNVGGSVIELSALGALTSVTHDGTLTGDGTPGNPLSVVADNLAQTDQNVTSPIRIIRLQGNTNGEKMRVANLAGDEVVEFYGDKTSRYFETVTFDKNLRLNDTFPAFINNGPSSGKQYDFKSEIPGFNTFSIVLGGSGGITQLNSNAGAFSMNQVLRFDTTHATAPPFIYTNNPTGRLGIDGGNTNQGHIVIWANGQVSFGGQTGSHSVHASALVDVKTDPANVRGSLVIPRMTEAQMLSIPSPAVGLMVYVTDSTDGLYVYKAGGWTLIA